MTCSVADGGIIKVDNSKYFIEMPVDPVTNLEDKKEVTGHGQVVTYDPDKCKIEVRK